jgi:NAD(P)-dependent dehydrogenase (short-subunit alcohol dehydrogenase family)
MGGRSVVITGGTQGLGRGYALEFLRRGHHVAVCGRHGAAVEKAVQELEKAATGGAKVVGAVADTQRRADMQALWDLAAREFGRVDIWINNAGLARTGVDFSATRPDEIEAMIRTNIIGTMTACDIAVAGMKRQGAGRIYVTLGGGAKGRIVRGMTVYSTTKRALHYFAKASIKELAQDAPAVHVGTISPGVNITEGMLREIAAMPPAERPKLLKPLNFLGEHVETTAPWIVERILADTRQGSDITWLTTGRMLRRGLGMMFRKRDILSRYGLSV